MWLQIKALLPSYFTYWTVLVALATAGWYTWTQVYPNYKFNWRAPVLLATVFGFYHFATNVTSLYQNGLLYSIQQQLQAQQAQMQQQPGNAQQASIAPLDPATQMKMELLKTIESVIRNPAAVNEDLKNRFFKQYEALIPKKRDERQAFAKPVIDIIQCQRFFWEDAMASYKAKTPVKSEGRAECEKKSGTFFNREKLLPNEVIAKNDSLIASIARRETIPGANGQPVEIKEQMLREAYEAETAARDSVKRLFE